MAFGTACVCAQLTWEAENLNSCSPSQRWSRSASGDRQRVELTSAAAGREFPELIRQRNTK